MLLPRNLAAILTPLSKVKGLAEQVELWTEAKRIEAWFDRQWYLSQNPDVAAQDVDPVRHYVKYGWREGRRPTPTFDPKWYLAENADVAKLGRDPFRHYVEFGHGESRPPSAEATIPVQHVEATIPAQHVATEFVSFEVVQIIEELIIDRLKASGCSFPSRPFSASQPLPNKKMLELASTLTAVFEQDITAGRQGAPEVAR